MSNIYNQYLLYCLQQYQPCHPILGCDNDPLCSCACGEQGSCTECLSNMFNDGNHRNRRYCCTPITYSYVIRYTNRYASEIYKGLKHISFDLFSHINIVSIGSGPSTELISLERYFRDYSIGLPTHYTGYDTNNIWGNCQNEIARIVEKSNPCIKVKHINERFMPQEVSTSTSGINILIMNYVISDILKHYGGSVVNDFLNNTITPLLRQMPPNSYVLVNDVNSSNMGRDEIEAWVNSLNRVMPEFCG